MSGSAPALAVLAEHVIQTALNLFFPPLLLFWGKHRGKAFQHNSLSLEGDGPCFSLVGYRLYHLGLLSESGLKPSVPLLSCGETRKGSARQRALPFHVSPRFGSAWPEFIAARVHITSEKQQTSCEINFNADKRRGTSSGIRGGINQQRGYLHLFPA